MAVSPTSAWAQSAAPPHLTPNRFSRTELLPPPRRILGVPNHAEKRLRGSTGDLLKKKHYTNTITVTNCNDSGTGSLRSALATASPGTNILFDYPLGFCSIRLQSTLTIRTHNLTIDGSNNGNGIALDGHNEVPIIEVNPGITVTLGVFTIANGALSNQFPGGGGLYNNGGTVNIVQSIFLYNYAPFGGGLFNNGGTVNITDSTFADNSSCYGAALRNESGGMITIEESTFAENTATCATSTLQNANGTINLSASIVAYSNGGGADCSGTITDGSYNLDDDGTCDFTTANHDLPNTNADLMGVRDNGGPTQTIA